MTSTPIVYSRKKPFPARLIENRRLNLAGSEKETRHYVLSLSGSGLGYEVGDSIGVFAQNDPELVDQILQALRFNGDEAVTNKEGESFTIRNGLLRNFQITQPSRQFLEAIAQRSEGTDELKELLQSDRTQELEHYLWGMEVIDFLIDRPSIQFTAQEFATTLRKLQPRLYSIASSLKAFPESVHLMIATVRYESHGRQRKGVASTYLAERVGPEGGIPVFVHVAKGFRLPQDPSTPIIMIGPGTGVAPFRAYLQERHATGAPGRNWLFFGEQRYKCDFFYQEELEYFQKAGLLTRLTTAFSRDQAHKIYVQHRLLENSKDIYTWLEEGAHLYVCGDAARMAKDVDVALHQIVATEGGKTPEQAAEYIEALRKEKRYKKDVY